MPVMTKEYRFGLKNTETGEVDAPDLWHPYVEKSIRWAKEQVEAIVSSDPGVEYWEEVRSVPAVRVSAGGVAQGIGGSTWVSPTLAERFLSVQEAMGFPQGPVQIEYQELDLDALVGDAT